MRENKVRAWDTEANTWLEGITLTLHTSGRLILVPPNIILTWWTGLKDTAGTDIYEGDIVEYMDNTSQGLVKKVAVIEDIRYLPSFVCSKWEKIIGNVYENSELVNNIEKRQQPEDTCNFVQTQYARMQRR